MTGKPTDRAAVAAAEALAHAPNGEGAIVAAVALATNQGRRVTSLCRFNMEIVIVVD